jgi:hypothetical protein
MARRLTQEKNASGVRTSYGHMVGYTWTSTHAAPIVLVRLISFAAGVSFMVSISCFLRNAGRRYIFSGTRLCNRRHRRCRRVFAPPLPPSPARLHPDSLGRLHALLLGKHEHHRLQSWAGANESIRVCPPLEPPVGDLPSAFTASSAPPRSRASSLPAMSRIREAHHWERAPA